MTAPPPGWASATIGEVAKCQLGKMLSERARRTTNPLPYLRNVNIRWDSFDFSNLLSMDFDDREIQKYALLDGDVLVCEGGEPGRAAVWRDQLPGMLYQKAIHRVRPHPGVLPDYLMYHLWWLADAGKLSRHFTGSTIKHLPQQALEAVPVQIPPSEEQSRIVQSLRESMSRLSAAVEQISETRRKLAGYRATVLRAACEGRLVPTEAELARVEKRKPETASEIAIQARDKKAKEFNRQKARRGVSLRPLKPAVTARSVIPEGWCWGTIDDISWIDVGFAFKSERFANSGMRLLRGENIEPGRLRWNNVKYWSAEEVEEFRDLIVEKGDVILAMDRPVISSGLKIAVAREDDVPALLVQRVARLRFITPEVRKYVFLTLNLPGFVQHLSATTTGTQLPHITAEGIRSYPIPLPPLAEQHRIVAEVDRRLSVVERLESAIETNFARAKRLRRAILKRAFEGGLVPQDPRDEPASALLDRLKRQAAAQSTFRELGVGKQ